MCSHVYERKLYKIKLEDDISIENARIMAVAAAGLQQLIKKAADFFKLDASSIDIVAPCGSYISDDETLDFIYTKDSVFIVKLNHIVPGVQSLPNPSNEDQLLETTDVMETRPSSPLTQHVVSDQLSSRTSNNRVEYFDVPKIMKEMRAGVKGDTAQEICNRLLNCEQASEHDARLIRCATGTWLISHFSENGRPTHENFLKMAKSIIHFYPSLANKSSKQPWDLIYDYATKKGPLEYYCRGKRYRKKLYEARNIEETISAEHTAQPAYTLEDVSEAELFMREKPIIPDLKAELMRCFEITRTARRAFVSDKTSSLTQILNRYPILKHMEEAVHDEFFFITNKKLSTFIENWKAVERKVFDAANGELNDEPAKILCQEAATAIVNYDWQLFSEKVLQLLPYLLPCESPAQKKKGKRSQSASFGLIFRQINELLTPIGAVERAMDLNQPALLRMADAYFIKVEETPIKLPESIKQLPEAIGYLLMFHYILGTSYPDIVSPVYGFF